MNPHDRRIGVRVPLEMFLNEYVQDVPHRALTTNLSETGVFLNKVITPISRPSRVVSLELALPGTADTIWARGEICYDSIDDYFHGQGIRFTAMARAHARLLRDFCVETRRAHLGAMLDKIRRGVVN
jgi:hypothetical protein